MEANLRLKPRISTSNSFEIKAPISVYKERALTYHKDFECVVYIKL